MSIRALIDEGVQYLMNRRGDNIAKKPRYPPVGRTETRTDANGKTVCAVCGGEIVQVNDRGTKACWKCGKKAQ